MRTSASNQTPYRETGASHAAVLCPSFYKAEIVFNPSRWDRIRDSSRKWLIGAWQRRAQRALERRAF